MGTQEGKWNFQGSNDVMVPRRKVNLAESEELCTASLPSTMSSQWKEGGREVVWALEGSGAPEAVTDTEERIVNPTGKINHSHLLEGAC